MLFLLVCDRMALPTSICLFFVEENSSPLLKQQLPKLVGFRDSWIDVTTHSETQTHFCTESRSTSLGVAEAGTLRLDLRALKSQNPFFFLKIPFNTVYSYHNYKSPVGRIDTLSSNDNYVFFSFDFFAPCRYCILGSQVTSEKLKK